MTKIKCLIVDDEEPAIKILEKYAGMIDQIDVVSTCTNAIEAFEVLKKKQIDLLFIDVNMPVLSGVEFVKSLIEPPAIIFTTAYRKYAIESYEVDALDYLLKPFGFDRFLKAVDKYHNRFGHPLDMPEEKVEHIFYKVNRTNHKVMIGEILYLESLKDYTQIHTLKGKLVVRGNLSTSMKELPMDRFIRIHRSFTIALDKIESYNQSEVTINGNQLPIGQSYKDAFLSKMHSK